MDANLNCAVIFGEDKFGAERLISKLKEKEIKVIRGDYEEIPENPAYIFDFEGREDIWRELRESQKLVLVRANNNEGVEKWREELVSKNVNWRIVYGENVYGEGMEDEGFLGRAFYLAAKNKNLVLPALKNNYRVLALDDFIEATLRACFFSGTSGKTLRVFGAETNSKIVAEVLIDEAKMTRTQVIQDDRTIKLIENDTNLVEETWKLLRWEPEISFKEGAKEAVQYFVGKVDQESRNKGEEKKYVPKFTEKREKVERRFEVEVESESEPIESSAEVVEEKEIEIEVEAEKKEEEAEEKFEEKEVEEEGEEFRIERFEKSPLPERAIEEEIEEKGEEIEKKTEEKIIEKKEKFKIEKKYWKWGGWGILWIVLVVFLINLIKIVSIPQKILGVQNLIENGRYVEAETEISKLKKQNESLLSFTGGGKSELLLRSEDEVLDLMTIGIEVAKEGEVVSGGIFGEDEVDLNGEIKKLEGKVDEAISKTGVLEGRLQGQWKWLPGKYREEITKLKNKLSENRIMLEKIRKITPVLPEILGLDGKRREYMVLLQNENELRAGGGFIGSYAILSFENGKLLNFEVKDIYEADGQLKGHVEPPGEIKKYLGEAAWFMRDANWSASFPVAVKDIQWFLEKETSRKVDGVIGINLAAVKRVLGVVGEVYVSDFKEKVNENNLYEQAEYYSETKFFAGSVQKASFLGGVSKQLMEEIKSAKGSEAQGLLMALIDLLERNEVQIVLNENRAAAIVAEAGWDGAIYEGQCNGEKCLADYLYIVESNFGVNKANYFLYRNIEREVEINESEVRNTLKIAYENTAKSSAWPGGDYKNYLRIYVPMGTNIKEINLSENGSGEKKIISGNDLKISQVGSKEEIGFLVVIPIGKKINVEVKYTQGLDIKALKNFSFLSYIQRQSGYGDTGMVTLVSIPEGWQINAVEPAASVVGGKLLFNQKLDRDIKMGVEISR